MIHAQKPSLPLPALLLLLALCLCQACAPRAISQSQPKEGILLVAFGASAPEARSAYERIGSEYRRAFPGLPIEWAFTSQIIRKKLAAQGVPAPSVGEALAALSRQGVELVRAQSLHVMAGEEFTGLERALDYYLQEHPRAFKEVWLGRPLLESRRDAREAAQALKADLGHHCASGEAIVLMGHGQSRGRAGLAMEGARAVFKEEDPHFFLATVEGERDFDELEKELRAAGAKKLLLAPLMLVAGEHARSDLGGAQEDSWASRFKKAGFKVEGVSLKGLGERDGVAPILIRHSREAEENLMAKPKKL